MKGYVKAIKKRIRADYKYFMRHGIDSDKLDYIAESLNERLIEAAWHAKELEGLSYDEKIKKIASLAVFPTEISRAQAEGLVRVSAKTGQNLSFADVLKGKFDWNEINATRDELIELYKRSGYSENEAKKKAKLDVSQQFFGSP